MKRLCYRFKIIQSWKNPLGVGARRHIITLLNHKSLLMLIKASNVSTRKFLKPNLEVRLFLASASIMTRQWMHTAYDYFFKPRSHLHVTLSCKACKAVVTPLRKAASYILWATQDKFRKFPVTVTYYHVVPRITHAALTRVSSLPPRRRHGSR